MKKVTAIVIGAGNRGNNYAIYSKECPDFEIIGVAEPRERPRNLFKKFYEIPDDMVFKDWREAIKLKKCSDVAIITMQDRLHKEAAVAFANQKYNLLLEKPMGVSASECEEIVSACKENDVILAVCHVLRYAPQARKIKELIASGVIGDVMNIQHIEPVGYWHYAHSYVRGNWRNEALSSSSLLAKSCHDIDLINYWMSHTYVDKVTSFGSLSHFKKENKPEGAGSRCVDCSIEDKCPYSAKALYLERAKQGNLGWPVSVVTEGYENVESTKDLEDIVKDVQQKLETGPYGRCVYDCDNDVMSQQVVNLQFKEGQTCSFTMVACTQKICVRSTKIFGSMGQLTCDFDGPVYHFDFNTKITTPLYAEEYLPSGSKMTGHDGADYHLIKAFVEAIQTGDRSKILSGPDETLSSHLLVFAAELARKENRVVNLDQNGRPISNVH
ncbi:unnamed protein product [Owenia fusiformis]|uniref:Uncharacterized protein n=1 Tax=Owenia fusiformis TaxID=6347 RepID=A0A8S4Q4K9_OWEFU|nr:unnamed protein product [Owenia fusiformis]